MRRNCLWISADLQKRRNWPERTVYLARTSLTIDRVGDSTSSTGRILIPRIAAQILRVTLFSTPRQSGTEAFFMHWVKKCGCKALFYSETQEKSLAK